MISLDANIRNTKTKGELSALRNSGGVPAVIYGGEAQNETVSISKKLLKSLIDKQNFLFIESIILKPTLCLLFSLSGVGLPKPTNKSIFF